MPRLTIDYGFAPGDGPARLRHPLTALLRAVEQTGSVAGAARLIGRSYRHVWGELHRWEARLGTPLVEWVQGHPGTLTPFARGVLAAERRAIERAGAALVALDTELRAAYDSVLGPGALDAMGGNGHDAAADRGADA